jgi:hypothetical protein
MDDFFIVQAERGQLSISVFWSNRESEFRWDEQIVLITLAACVNCLPNSVYLLIKTDLNERDKL